MSSRPHLRAAAFVSSLLLAATFAAGAALASTTPSMAPPPPPDEPPPPGTEQMQAPGGIDQFRPTLQQFGSFHSHPLYGEVWKPSEQIAPPGWSPYPVCHWQFDREQRTWVFADPTEWGSIVHRHGRWANDPQHGWIWVADANFGPGWVIWRSEPNAISWAPMLPEQLGNLPPRDGWQRQDTATFNSGCRQSAPPAPVAGPPPPPEPGPMPRMADDGPGFGSGGGFGGGPVFIPGRPIFVPGRPPFAGGLPPACATGIRPSWCRPVCATRPFSPGCRPPFRGPLAGQRVGNPCGRFPTLVACRTAARPFPVRPFVNRPFGRPHFAHRPFQHRPFAGGFRGGHRMAFGHRGGGRSFRR
jgi:hypothetical protein